LSVGGPRRDGSSCLASSPFMIFFFMYASGGVPMKTRSAVARRRFGFTNPRSLDRLSCMRSRRLLEALEERRLLSVGLAGAGLGDGVQAGSTAQHQTLADLPVAAQQAVSSAIGQDQSAHHAAFAATGVTMANPANGFTAQVHLGTLLVPGCSDFVSNRRYCWGWFPASSRLAGLSGLCT